MAKYDTLGGITIGIVVFVVGILVATGLVECISCIAYPKVEQIQTIDGVKFYYDGEVYYRIDDQPHSFRLAPVTP